MKLSRGMLLLLLAPTLLVLGVFIFYPALQSLYFSFHDVDAFTREKSFVGLENYAFLLSSREYWQSLTVTFLFLVMTVVPSIVISLLIAMGLDANPFCQGIFRTLFLFPVAISSAMAAMLWIFLFNPTVGYLNYALSWFGIAGPNWLTDPDWALLACAISTIWKDIGFNVIFFLAGLASVPTELKEAARLDGANPWHRFRHVILPLLSPTLFFVFVVSLIHGFQGFGQIHILTKGGPARSTNVLVYNLYRDAFVNFQTGLASAESVVLFGLILMATLIQFRVAKKRVHYG